MACNAFKICLGIGIAGLSTLVLGVLTGWVIVPIVVRSKIAEILPLKPDTESWDRWKNPPVPIQYRVFIFNVNNPDEILKGEMPDVTEIGPYVYNEKRIKNILSVDEVESTVEYEQKFIFEFDKESSAPLTEDDVLTVVNAPAMLFGLTVDNLKYIDPVINLYNTSVQKMWPTSNLNPIFIKARVKDYLFDGLPIYCNQSLSIENVDSLILCQAFKILHPKTITLNEFGKDVHSFSFLKYKTNISDGVFKVDLGIHDVTKIGQILSWNNVSLLSVWKGESCNRILGTDTTVFRPHLKADDIKYLYIYHTDICSHPEDPHKVTGTVTVEAKRKMERLYKKFLQNKTNATFRSIKLIYDSDTEYKGVKGRRYVPDKSFLNSVLNDSETHCFCPQSLKGVTHYGGCLLSGVLELSGCQGAPAILSYPHFLMADRIYQKVKGLNPDVEKHQIFVDLEPNTGYPLRAASRVQINIFLKAIREVHVMKNLPNVMIPAIWIEEKMDLTDELIDTINSQLLNILLIVDIIKWLMIASGIILFSGSCGYYFVKLRPEKTQKIKKNYSSHLKSK